MFTVELHAVLLTQEQNRGVRERDRFRQEEEEEKEEEVSNWLRGPRRRGESDGRRVKMRDVGLQRQHGCKHEVFLGGSCNPTTWRRDLAIPRLKSNDITYFNPVRLPLLVLLQPSGLVTQILFLSDFLTAS